MIIKLKMIIQFNLKNYRIKNKQNKNRQETRTVCLLSRTRILSRYSFNVLLSLILQGGIVNWS